MANARDPRCCAQFAKAQPIRRILALPEQPNALGSEKPLRNVTG